MDSDKISVIIPVYNVEKYLHKCVYSVINQTYKNLEIILIDDGSTDNCGKICNDLADIDHRIKVVHKANSGLGMARNSGIKVATGKYISFVDADDWLNENFIMMLHNRISKCNADFAIGGLIRKRINGRETISAVTDKISLLEGKAIVDEILLPIIGTEPWEKEDVGREMSVCTNMYRKFIVDNHRIKFLSEKKIVSEDLIFNLEYIGYVKRAVLIPENNYFYRENLSSLTHTFRQDRFEKYCGLFYEVVNILEKMEMYEIAKIRLYRTFIMKTKKCIASLACCDLTIRIKVRECKSILNNELFKNIIRIYSSHVCGLKQKIIVLILRYKQAVLLLLLYNIKNKRLTLNEIKGMNG